MGRARGANARIVGAFETIYGTAPATGFMPLPFVRSTLGPEQGLIEDDLLGNGREKYDPTLDVVVNDGQVVVPVDVRNFGHWLKLLLGAPTTTGSAAPYTHAFASGATALPSMSIETQLPDVPSYEMNYGLRANSLQIGLSRRGLLNATVELVGKGAEARASTSDAGTVAAALALTRFRQATGEIKREGVTLGSIVSAEVNFTNSLDKVETIQPDGEIEDADPAQAMVSGSIVSRYSSLTLHQDAINGEPVELTFGWTAGAHSLLFTVPRAFLPRVKTPIEGPGGIQSSANFMGSGAEEASFTATLVNDVESYA